MIMRAFLGAEGNVFEDVPADRDMFGFDWVLSDLGQAMSLQAANARYSAMARSYLGEFDRMVAEVRKMPSGSPVRMELEQVIRSENLFRQAEKTRDRLNRNIEWIYVDLKTLKVNDRRVGDLKDFRKSVKTLRKRYVSFVVLPALPPEKSEVQIVREVGLPASTMLSQAQEAATRAKASRSPADIAVARALAEQAREAGLMEGNPEIASDAQALINDLDTIAVAAGVPDAGKRVDEGLGTGTILAIAGGAAALIGIIYFATRK